MSAPTRSQAVHKLRRSATLFAALGDETRLTLLARLGERGTLSITQLAQGEKITRQAISKHLRVLQNAGVVRSVRRGRESVFRLETKPLQEAGDSLQGVSRQWDDALARLKAFVEG